MFKRPFPTVILVALAATAGFSWLPAEQPGAPALMKNPSWDNVREGDWIEHRMILPIQFPMETRTKQTVIQLTADIVTVKLETSLLMAGKSLPPESKINSYPRTVPATQLAPPPGKKLSKRVKASDGREYECIGYPAENDGQVAITWTSPEIPFGGLVLTEVDGKPMMELVGWGRGEFPETPPEPAAKE